MTVRTEQWGPKTMNETILISSVIVLAALWIVIERALDLMPASHWINEYRRRFENGGSTDIGGDWGNCGGDGGD